MFATLILLATVGATADEWRPLTADARYEVRGHMSRGVFVYQPASKRARGVAAPINYGVHMPSGKDQIHSASEFEVTGTDRELGRTIADAAVRSAVAKAAPEQCPLRPKPKPDPFIPNPAPVIEAKMLITIISAVVGLAFFLAFNLLLLILLFLVVRWAYRRLTEPKPPAPTP